MQAIPRWGNALSLKNSFIQVATSSLPLTHLSLFHSTPISFGKWKNKWNSDARRGQEPSKNYIRYATHQKRADAKQALKDLLFNYGSSGITFEDEFSKANGRSSWDAGQADNSDNLDKKSRSKSSARHAKARLSRMKRAKKCKFRRESLFDDLDDSNDPETIFQATYGNRWYTWSFKSWSGDAHFQRSTHGFEWREKPNWANSRDKNWETASEYESYDESCVVGSCSDRAILGLPQTGPLKIEEVKNAFRLSALKWHPDKHQGPAQAMAEEKFKHCVNAYKSLRDALSLV